MALLLGAVPAQPAAAVLTDPPPAAAAASAAPAPRYVPSPPKRISCRAHPHRRLNLRCLLGRSVQGRPIVATRQGPASAPRVLVVSGQMHGDEWPGPVVVNRVRALAVPAGLQVWTVRTMNPDGMAHRRRHNAHGVDLNRNFPAAWRARPYAGARPLSEPEARAIRRLLSWLQPDLLVSFHGFSEAVDTTGGGRRAAAARAFSRLAHIGPAARVPCGGPCAGNLTDWYTSASTVGGVAFTV
ncbi:MAG TPA: DUF2817 domain-containing protein, partial [Candidatus Nanopelagicales bacterium]|nr:DUF2817 domain-containing protein [Candidatus Nanopelagicales bacterium]